MNFNSLRMEIYDLNLDNIPTLRGKNIPLCEGYKRNRFEGLFFRYKKGNLKYE